MGIIMKTIKRSYSSDMRKEDDPTQLIKDFMKRHKITNYTINPDKSVDVNCGIIIYKNDLIDGKIPFKFGKVSGDFDCSWCGLSSLEGCPDEVGCDFDCIYNQLSSLEGCPEEVGFDFDCNNNKKQFTKEEVEQYCKVKGLISWV